MPDNRVEETENTTISIWTSQRDWLNSVGEELGIERKLSYAEKLELVRSKFKNIPSLIKRIGDLHNERTLFLKKADSFIKRKWNKQSDPPDILKSSEFTQFLYDKDMEIISELKK